MRNSLCFPSSLMPVPAQPSHRPTLTIRQPIYNQSTHLCLYTSTEHPDATSWAICTYVYRQVGITSTRNGMEWNRIGQNMGDMRPLLSYSWMENSENRIDFPFDSQRFILSFFLFICFFAIRSIKSILFNRKQNIGFIGDGNGDGDGDEVNSAKW